MRYVIKLSYSGAGFHGWQVQPGAPSVQQCLETALGTLLGGAVAVTGAGRTDTGVNALGYVACFDGPEGLDTPVFRYKLNAILPASVAVASVQVAADDFHARFDAVRREYTYFIHREKDPFVTAFSCFCGYPELDFDAMNRAAQALLGTHDFACFEKTGADNKTSVCTVFEALWAPYTPSHISVMGLPPVPQGSPRRAVGPAIAPQKSADFRGPHLSDRRGSHVLALPGRLNPTHAAPAEGQNYWYFRIAADRFLRNMVRAIVGTLIEVGRGKRTPDSIPSLIEGRDRCAAGQSVPGHALFLSKVLY